ncbi:MAG: sugar phosphate nucleotidyltransferase, partial [Candidatus Heimdallarchaeota archaeon]
RIIYSVKETGLTDIIIVIGHKGEIIKREIGDGEKYGITIQYIKNSEWKKGNATSVYSVRDTVGDNFVLLMADHLFDTQNLKKVINFPLAKNACLLATDSNMDHIYDLQESTKVYLNNSKIMNIGKELLNYNAIDTGMFRFTKSIFDALEKSFIENKYNLQDAIGYLIKNGLMYATDIGNKFWQDIDTQVDLQLVKNRLLARQKI